MRKTKIVCTLGPATDQEGVLREMMRAGMNVARFNFSHGSHAEHGARLDQLKKLREELDLPVAAMLDTRGPEVRLKTFAEGSVTLRSGAEFTLTTEDIVGSESRCAITYAELPGDVKEYLVWINKEDLDKAGLEVPPLDWTWDDFEEYAQKLTWGEGPDKHYGAMLYTWDHYNVLTAYNRLDDNPYLNEDGTLNLDDPAFRESLELRYRLEQETQCAIPLSEVMATNLDFRTAFFSGKCSMLLMATNIIPQTADLENYPHTFQTTYASFPMPEGGRPGYAYADNRFYSIGATTVNAEEAYKYIRYFTTEGIPMKGVTFTADTNNTTGITDVVELMTATNPELYDKEQLLKVLTNPNLKNNFWEYVPSYTGEIVNLYRAQAEKAVMGEISFDEALSVATEQCQQVIDNNQ